MGDFPCHADIMGGFPCRRDNATGFSSQRENTEMEMDGNNTRGFPFGGDNTGGLHHAEDEMRIPSISLHMGLGMQSFDHESIPIYHNHGLTKDCRKRAPGR